MDLLSIDDPRPELFVKIVHAWEDMKTGEKGGQLVAISDGGPATLVEPYRLRALIEALGRAEGMLCDPPEADWDQVMRERH